jgi:hypothetical protein
MDLKLPKPKLCKICRERFSPTRMIQPCCAKFECMLAYAQQAAEKSAQKRKVKESKALREAKEKVKRKSEWIAETQTVFNKFVRLRDRLAGHNCISSGRPLNWSGNAVDAGHYRSRGSAPHLRFNEDNCHAQSKHDNRYKSGSVTDYRIGLIKRIGIERVEALEADQTERHYTIDDLKELKAYYQKKCKEIEKEMNHGHS